MDWIGVTKNGQIVDCLAPCELGSFGESTLKLIKRIDIFGQSSRYSLGISRTTVIRMIQPDILVWFRA